jgi:hypothetical protein
MSQNPAYAKLLKKKASKILWPDLPATFRGDHLKPLAVMTGAFLLPRLLNPKNKNPPSLAGHSLALVRQVYYCPPRSMVLKVVRGKILGTLELASFSAACDWFLEAGCRSWRTLEVLRFHQDGSWLA